ncbi:MAG: hypothetical protein NZR01_02505, partial [Bryobacteraceae bacterium]|nr:hypothetical protein [Bryobacteraceae bacterium]
ETAASRSMVRLRLSSWAAGGRKTWQGLDSQRVQHPEVNQPVGPHLYLGYGPLIYDGPSRQTALKSPPCIDAGECAELQVAFPEQETGTLEQALALMHLFGAAGGRSRNGWGSIRLLPGEGAQLQTALPLRDWREALALDWAHCIGKDEQGALIWRTVTEYSDWKELMRDLSCLKIALRTQFRWTNQVPDARHWLAYPVTKHKVDEWESRQEGRQRRALNLRLPNTLRFKIRCVNGDPQRLIGVIFHMPCSPPPEFSSTEAVLAKVWREIHQLLDELGKPPDRRQLTSTLRPTVIQQIKGVKLQRTEE